jgi:8-oxo-dGTP pyrophosphatase MutT (NUDIX family)
MINDPNGSSTMLPILLDAYRRRYPGEAEVIALFESFLAERKDAFARSCPPGHFTGSAWLVSADGERVLLTHHRKLNLWLQLGGHADGDPNLARVALREGEEESGLSNLSVEDAIFDLDRHAIPAHESDPSHFHYDVRFVVRANGDETYAVGDESHDLAWRRIAEIAVDENADASVRRMANKWLAGLPSD